MCETFHFFVRIQNNSTKAWLKGNTKGQFHNMVQQVFLLTTLITTNLDHCSAL